jgi:hypothetical protein
VIKNKSYQNAWRHRSRGADQVLDGAKFYRPPARTRTSMRQGFRRPGPDFIPLKGVQLELFTPAAPAPIEIPKRDEDRPLGDLFPSAYLE